MRVYGQRYQGKTELVRKRKKWYRQSAIALFLLYAFFLMVKAGTGRETLAKRFFSYIQNEISMSDSIFRLLPIWQRAGRNRH